MKSIRILALGLLAGTLGSALFGAADDTAQRAAASTAAAQSPSSGASQSTSNYTNTWEQSRTVDYYSSGSSYYGSRYGSSFYGGSGFNRYWDYPNTYSVSYRVLKIYFPNDPVILAQWLPASSSSAKPRNSVLAQMRPYLSDRFFPAMSAYMHNEDLSNKRLTRISDYRAEKQKILAEMRSRIDQIRQADATARPSLYAELAAQQSSQILALEAKEEEIRHDFTSGGIFSSSVDWNDTRSWRLGDDSRYESYLDEYQVMRASAYFNHGFSVQQRDLLREIAMEISKRGQDPTSDIGLDSTGPYFFFTPSTSRIRLPLEMPDELRSKIDQYRTLKDSMKRELRNMVYQTDRAWLNSTRTNAAKELAAKQASQFMDLERLAEEIRVGLAPLKYPDEPDQSALPTGLAAQITTYLQAKTDLNRALRTRLTEAQGILPKDRIEIVPMGGGYGIEIVASRGSSKEQTMKREDLRAQLNSFNHEQVQRFQNLAVQKEKLRQQIKVASNKSSTEIRSVEQLLTEFARAFARQEMWNRYKDYRSAVLDPGLSPEQRRLLYGSALEFLMADYMN